MKQSWWSWFGWGSAKADEGAVKAQKEAQAAKDAALKEWESVKKA